MRRSEGGYGRNRARDASPLSYGRVARSDKGSRGGSFSGSEMSKHLVKMRKFGRDGEI